MSDYQAEYQSALAEYRAKVRRLVLTGLPVVALDVLAQFVRRGNLGTIVMGAITAGWAFWYQNMQRKLWKAIEIKHGLIYGVRHAG